MDKPSQVYWPSGLGNQARTNLTLCIHNSISVLVDYPAMTLLTKKNPNANNLSWAINYQRCMGAFRFCLWKCSDCAILSTTQSWKYKSWRKLREKKDVEKAVCLIWLPAHTPPILSGEGGTFNRRQKPHISLSKDCFSVISQTGEKIIHRFLKFMGLFLRL